MQILKTAARAALTISLAAAPLGAALAAFPGENGVIVYSLAGALWKVAANGTKTPIDTPQYVTNPAVSPNGKRLAVMSADGVITQSLRVMNLDGSGSVVIDQIEYVDLFSAPAWSPDGKTLTLMDRLGNVFLYDVATSAKRTLVAGMTTFRPSGRMAWSPLGDKISGDALYESWWINVANGQVSKMPSFVYPDWFPDYGGTLVGISTLDDSSYGCLVRMAPDGSGRTVFPGCSNAYPTVSPDGTALLASNYLSGGLFKLSVRDFQGQSVQDIAAQADKRADWSRVPKTAMRTTLTNDQWSPAVPLASDSDSYLSEADIAVMPDGAAGNYLRQAVGVGVDGRVYHRAQHSNGTWTSYAVVPGVGRIGAGVHAKRVAIAGALDGSAQVVIVGANDIVYHAVRYTNGSWSGFNQVGGFGGAVNFAARDVAIAIVNSSTSTPGQAHLVVNGLADGAAYHRIRLDNGSWTAWLPIGNSQTQSLAIAFDAGTNAYVLATSPSQGVTRRVRNPDGSWNNWVPMATTAPGPLKGVTLALSRSSDTAWVGYVGADGAVWSQTVLNPAMASSWEQPPLTPAFVMPTGRTVSMGYTLSNGLELVVVQAQPQ